MDVVVKRVYAPVGSDDGLRVLVDRLWPRGESKDRAHLDLWLKDVAPSTELRRWFGHDPQRFEEFARRYRAELDATPGPVAELRSLVETRPRVTLLFSAHDDAHNNAVVLAQYLTQHLTQG
ncbi:MAG: DUF488 domain-containing protein [Cellulomonadaceae bacterium]